MNGGWKRRKAKQMERVGAMKHKTKQESEVTCIVRIQGRKDYQKSYSEKQQKRWK